MKKSIKEKRWEEKIFKRASFGCKYCGELTFPNEVGFPPLQRKGRKFFDPADVVCNDCAREIQARTSPPAAFVEPPWEEILDYFRKNPGKVDYYTGPVPG